MKEIISQFLYQSTNQSEIIKITDQIEENQIQRQSIVKIISKTKYRQRSLLLLSTMSLITLNLKEIPLTKGNLAPKLWRNKPIMSVNLITLSIYHLKENRLTKENINLMLLNKNAHLPMIIQDTKAETLVFRENLDTNRYYSINSGLQIVRSKQRRAMRSREITSTSSQMFSWKTTPSLQS